MTSQAEFKAMTEFEILQRTFNTVTAQHQIPERRYCADSGYKCAIGIWCPLIPDLRNASTFFNLVNAHPYVLKNLPGHQRQSWWSRLQNAHDKATACESPANSDAFKTKFRQEILNEFNYLVAMPKE